MMKIKILLFVLIFSGSSLLAQKVKLSGEISGGNFTEIQIKDVLTSDVVQTTEVKNNKFDFKFDLEDEDIYALFLDNDNYMLIDIKPGDNIEVYYDLDDFDAITVDGSEGTELYLNYIETVRGMTDLDDKIAFTDSLINAHSDKLISLLFGFNLGFDGYVDTHKKLIDGLESEFSDNAIYMDYVSEYNSANATAIGSIPPDIELTDKDGNIVTLYSLRGHYVLLDFWASWCRPCRGESPTLVSAYNKYHDDGFTIYSVSLDQTKDAWLQAIDDDGLGAWYHVSDLKGWQSAAGQLYGIGSIPANFLIDPDGKIVDKNLRGSALGLKLSDIFKH